MNRSLALSPIISYIFRKAFFPRKESRSTDESDLTDGQRRKSADHGGM